MNEFSLAKALNIIGKNLIISTVIFFVCYLTIPNLNLFDSKYKSYKTVVLGEYPNGHGLKLLNYKDISEIVASPNMAQYLRKKLENIGFFEVSTEKSVQGNISLTTISSSPDSIISIQNTVMARLQEIDQKAINKKLLLINRILRDERQVLDLLNESIDSFGLTSNDIKYYSSLQKTYDDAYDSSDVIENNSDIESLIRLKESEINRQLELTRSIIAQKQKIELLDDLIINDFKTVSFLYPPVISESSKYFPNNVLFFGISLFLVLLYNLFLLNYKFKQSAK